jgi:hypothetical protein
MTVAVLWAPAPVAAQQQDLPSADDLIAAYVERIGGASLWSAGSSVMRGAFILSAMGLQGNLTMVTRAPNQQRMDIELPGLGSIQQGFDGEVGWSVNPLTGPEIARGAELEQIREQSSAAASLRDPSVVPGRETVASAEVGGEPCWRVRLTWASGTISHDCYSKDSGFLIGSEAVQQSAMGAIAAVTRYLEYREIEGRWMPTRILQSAGGQDTELRIDSIEFTEVTDAQIAPPPAIQALRGG